MYRHSLTAIAAVSCRRGVPTLATTAAFFSKHHRHGGMGTTSTTTAQRLFATGGETGVIPVPKPPTSNHPHTPLPNAHGSMIYTETDEAPALATYSLYPVISKVSKRKLSQGTSLPYRIYMDRSIE
jgi:hypothetical protein